MERRPAGLIVAAIALGFVSLVLLGFSGMTALSMVVYRHGLPPTPGAVPGAPAPTVGMVLGMLAFFALLELAAAVWGGATTFGLLKLKRWARYSVMVFGGCVAALSLLFAVVMAAAPTMLKGMPAQPGTTPEQIRIVLLVMSVLSLMVAALGVGWIVYFALRKTRMLFESAAPLPVVAKPVQVNPMTDFTVAQPLPPEERIEGQVPPEV